MGVAYVRRTARYGARCLRVTTCRFAWNDATQRLPTGAPRMCQKGSGMGGCRGLEILCMHSTFLAHERASRLTSKVQKGSGMGAVADGRYCACTVLFPRTSVRRD